MSSRRAVQSSRAFVELGSRLTRDTLLYTVGTTLVLPVSLITTAFMTRHFPTAQYGQLAILFAFAGLLTVALNMVYLQGALLLVFVHADVGVAVDWGSAEVADRRERPIVLTSGLLMTAIVGAIVAGVIWLESAPLAGLLVNHRARADSVTLAAISSVAGALWRYVSNVTRLERKPSVYAASAAARPGVALALTVPLVLLGAGINSALIATAVGSLVSMAIALYVSRRSYAPVVNRRAIKRATRVGLPWIPVVAGLFIAHSADLLFLRTTSSNATLGLYRIADGLSSIISYAVSAFHLAQVPLEGTLIVQSAYAEHTRDRVMASYVLSYLTTALAITLLLSLGGGVVVAVLAPGYGKAVQWIPMTSLAYVGYGFLLVSFRAGDYYRNRIRAYALTAAAAGLSVMVLALILLHVVGVIGAPLGAALGCFGTAAALLALGFRAGHPLPLDYRRLFGAIALAAACWGLGSHIGHGAVAALARCLALIAFPVGLIALRIIPEDVAAQLPPMVRAILPRRTHPAPPLAELSELPPSQRDVLIACARDHLDPAAGAARLGVDEPIFLSTVARALRTLAGGSGEFPLDQELASYLVLDVPAADRDELLRTIRKGGANMLEFRAMERVYKRLRGAPARAWTEAVLTGHVPPAAASAPDRALGVLAHAGWDVTKAASGAGIQVRDLYARAIDELRERAGLSPDGGADQLIAHFLLAAEPPPATQLWAAGVDPIELHRIDLALQAVREQVSAPKRRRRFAVPRLGRLPAPAATQIEQVMPRWTGP